MVKVIFIVTILISCCYLGISGFIPTSSSSSSSSSIVSLSSSLTKSSSFSITSKFNSPSPSHSHSKTSLLSSIHGGGGTTATIPIQVDTYRNELIKCHEWMSQAIDKENSAPLMLRIAWHDAGTYDKTIPLSKWPKCGGATGSIRFKPEIDYGCNAGMGFGFGQLCQAKNKFPLISWADIIQMSGAIAVKSTMGPDINMKYGRIDVMKSEDCSPDGRLPGAAAPYGDGAQTAQGHLRNIFYRMGMTDQEIVALSGAHSIGRAKPDRSGFGKTCTRWTDPSKNEIVRADGKEGMGAGGGSSWTEKWLKFDNDYFQAIDDPKSEEKDLLKLETDACLFSDEKFKKYAIKYRDSKDAFFTDYALAHKKLSELGCKWIVDGGISF